MRNALLAAFAAAAILLGASACDPATGTPPASSGHNPNRAGEPDPAPHAPKPSPSQMISVRFTVINNVDAVVTYNAGQGNKFIDTMRKPGESWTAGARKGAALYLSATPFHRGASGTISVKIENAASGKLLCHDTNFGNLKAGADCHGTAK